MAACSAIDNKNYCIEGTTTGIADSSMVYLRTFNATNDMIDSAVVMDGKFSISHPFDSLSANAALELTYIMSEEEQIWTGVQLFAEPGATIQVHLDLNEHSNNSIGGSPLNDKQSAFEKEMDEWNQKLDNLSKQVRDSSLNEQQRTALMVQYDSVFKQRINCEEQFALNNMDNIIGVSLIENASAMFSNEAKQQMLEKVSAEFKNHPAIVAEQKRMQAEANTAEGKPMADLEMATPEGEMVKLSSLVAKSKLTLIDFWASWCGPCRQEIPNIKKIYANYKSRGLGLVGVSFDTDKEKWVKAISDMHLDYPQMSDLKGWQCAASPIYNIQGIPFTLLVSKDGTIIGRNLHGDDLNKRIEEYFKKH